MLRYIVIGLLVLLGVAITGWVVSTNKAERFRVELQAERGAFEVKRTLLIDSLQTAEYNRYCDSLLAKDKLHQQELNKLNNEKKKSISAYNNLSRRYAAICIERPNF